MRNSQTFNIPIVLSNAQYLNEANARSYAGLLRIPIAIGVPSIAASQSGTDWVIPFSGSRTDGIDTLAVISLTASASDLVVGTVTFDTFLFSNSHVSISTIAGKVIVAGGCTPALGAKDTAFFIHSVQPNPSAGSFIVEYHIAATSDVLLELEDMIGRTTVLKRAVLEPGTYHESVDQPSLSGAYRLILSSGHRLDHKMIEILR